MLIRMLVAPGFSLRARIMFSPLRMLDRFRQVGIKLLNHSKQIKGDQHRC